MSKRSCVAPKTSWNLNGGLFYQEGNPCGSPLGLQRKFAAVYVERAYTHECPLRELNTVMPRSALHKSSFINRQDRKGPIQMTPKRGP